VVVGWVFFFCKALFYVQTFYFAGKERGRAAMEERGSAPHAAGEQPQGQLRPSAALTGAGLGLGLPLPGDLPKAEPGQGGFASPLEVARMQVTPGAVPRVIPRELVDLARAATEKGDEMM